MGVVVLALWIWGFVVSCCSLFSVFFCFFSSADLVGRFVFFFMKLLLVPPPLPPLGWWLVAWWLWFVWVCTVFRFVLSVVTLLCSCSGSEIGWYIGGLLVWFHKS
ncbi:hypothetical protein QL285_040636 [Trifolium repens]|nr:hypothetical protein QL285_040636 [Trifolium repens]